MVPRQRCVLFLPETKCWPPRSVLSLPAKKLAAGLENRQSPTSHPNPASLRTSFDTFDTLTSTSPPFVAALSVPTSLSIDPSVAPLSISACIESLPVSTLGDSGLLGAKAVMNKNLVPYLLDAKVVAPPVSLSYAGGAPVMSDPVISARVTVTDSFAQSIAEDMVIIPAPIHQDFILGKSWLAEKNPEIDWARNTLRFRPTFESANPFAALDVEDTATEEDIAAESPPPTTTETHPKAYTKPSPSRSQSPRRSDSTDDWQLNPLYFPRKRLGPIR